MVLVDPSVVAVRVHDRHRVAEGATVEPRLGDQTSTLWGGSGRRGGEGAIATAAITDATLIRLNISILLSSLPSRAEQKPGPVTVPADDLRAPRRVEGVLEGGVLRPAVAYRCRIAGMANGGGEPRPRRTGRRLRARRTRRDPDGRKRCDRQKRSYTSSHEYTPFHRFLLSIRVVRPWRRRYARVPLRKRGSAPVDARASPGLSASAERATAGGVGRAPWTKRGSNSEAARLVLSRGCASAGCGSPLRRTRRARLRRGAARVSIRRSSLGPRSDQHVT